MRMRTIVGRGAPAPVDEEQVAEKRAEVARRNPCWRELPEARLVARSRMLVDAETDLCYKRRLGDVFERGSAHVMFDQAIPLGFFVAASGAVVFVERINGTWSEIVERKARRGHAA